MRWLLKEKLATLGVGKQSMEKRASANACVDIGCKRKQGYGKEKRARFAVGAVLNRHAVCCWNAAALGYGMILRCGDAVCCGWRTVGKEKSAASVYVR
jgi:hypothetical protein